MINGDHIDAVDDFGTRRQSRRTSALTVFIHKMKMFGTHGADAADTNDGNAAKAGTSEANAGGKRSSFISNGSAASTAASTAALSDQDSHHRHKEDASLYPRTYLSRLMLQMKTCLEDLDAADVTWPKLESMAILIHESMSSSSRNYHSVQHVFDISKNLTHDPIAVLSAFFHDCIYYHVDGALTPIQADILQGVFTLQPNGKKGVIIQERTIDDDGARALALVETIFGFHHPGQEVTTQLGLNEFLSAIIAVRKLQDHLSWEILAQIACCIEATIPFRKPQDGKTPLDNLHANFLAARSKFQLDLSDEQCVGAVQRAVLLSNEDVGNFGTADRHWFLDNTWSLLPETNMSLRNQYIYTVHQFQNAIFKMNGFFGFIQPEVVFASFQGVPPTQELELRLRECRTNLRIGKIYVGAKLLAISVLSAFAELTGGDAPISLFMGDLPSRHNASTEHEDGIGGNIGRGSGSTTSMMRNMRHSMYESLFRNASNATPNPKAASLPPSQFPLLEDASDRCDPIVYGILAYGRRSEISFDIKQSPLAAYLYGSLGDDGLQRVLEKITFHPMTKENSIELLRALPREAVTTVGSIVMRVAVSRADFIRRVIEDLYEDEEAASQK